MSIIESEYARKVQEIWSTSEPVAGELGFVASPFGSSERDCHCGRVDMEVVSAWIKEHENAENHTREDHGTPCYERDRAVKKTTRKKHNTLLVSTTAT